MNAINYIGNCRNLIDCDSLLEELKSKEGVSRTIETPYGRGSDLTQNVDALCMYNAWKDAGYIDANCVEWINFYPETEFSSNYIDLLSKFLGIIPKNVWISSIKPGKCVPWHWDIEQNADEWSKEGSLTRYTVFIDTPKLGDRKSVV